MGAQPPRRWRRTPSPGTPGFAAAGGARGPAYDFLGHPGGDPALAARYLRRAGYRDGRYEGDAELLMVGVSGGNDQRAAEIARDSLERLGFKVKLRLTTADTMLTKFCGTPARACTSVRTSSGSATSPTPRPCWPRRSAAGASPRQGNTNVSQLDVPVIDRAMAGAARVVEARRRAAAWGRLMTGW